MSDNNELEISLRPMLHKYWFMCFSGVITKEEAQHKFAERYGKEPEVVMWADGLMWVGPLKEKPIK